MFENILIVPTIIMIVSASFFFLLSSLVGIVGEGFL